MTLYWRHPQLSESVHLSESNAHRALCGADVLNAVTDAETPRHMACVTCVATAERIGERRPPYSKPHERDQHTRPLL